jgi:tRNA1Val (adenine37-N6)-methyltransferase
MSHFHFKYFSIFQENAPLKVGTDAMLLGALAKFTNPRTIVDIGSGTGVLALMCRQRFSNAHMHAIEPNELAYSILKINVWNNELEHKVSVHNCTLQNFFPENPVDAVISNPPFFEQSLKNKSQDQSQARHTDTLSFDTLFKHTFRILKENGEAYFIFPHELQKKLIAIAKSNGLNCFNSIQIMAKPLQPVRVILGLKKIEKVDNCKDQSFVIRTETGVYTTEYKQLTREFHKTVL